MTRRLGVAAIIEGIGRKSGRFVLGRRNKDPNRDLWVFPGGGVEEGETLEEALQREVLEETGLRIQPDQRRWENAHVVEHLRIFGGESARCVTLFVWARVHEDDEFIEPVSGSDLRDVRFFVHDEMPDDVSPVVKPIVDMLGWTV